MSWVGTKRHQYFLVAGDEICSDPKDANDGLQPPRNWLTRHRSTIAVLFILAPSLAMNALLLYQNSNFCHRPDLGRSSFSS